MGLGTHYINDAYTVNQSNLVWDIPEKYRYKKYVG